MIKSVAYPGIKEKKYNKKTFSLRVVQNWRIRPDTAITFPIPQRKIKKSWKQFEMQKEKNVSG